jgi:hypothetical protein
MGLGLALMEEALFDERTGRIMNPSLAEYHVPVHLDGVDARPPRLYWRPLYQALVGFRSLFEGTGCSCSTRERRPPQVLRQRVSVDDVVRSRWALQRSNGRSGRIVDIHEAVDALEHGLCCRSSERCGVGGAVRGVRGLMSSRHFPDRSFKTNSGRWARASQAHRNSFPGPK